MEVIVVGLAAVLAAWDGWRRHIVAMTPVERPGVLEELALLRSEVRDLRESNHKLSNKVAGYEMKVTRGR